MRKLFKRTLIVLASIIGIIILAILIPFIYVRVGCEKIVKPAVVNDTSLLTNEVASFKETIPKYTRPEEKTYLTLPEWSIVYSAHEYANFLDHGLPSQFPYFASIAQYWHTYCQVNSIAQQYHTSIAADHLSLMVIGTSYTAEYAIKGVYENTIGWFSEVLGSKAMVEEDRYAQQVAQDYAQFLHTIPWYEFPFGEKLSGLWRDTSFFGPHFIRKIERKVFLTLEYGSKAVYGGVIRWATHATYGYQDLEIHVVVSKLPTNTFRDEPRIKEVKELGPNFYLVKMPRYEEFSELVLKLVAEGVQFVDVAGNDEMVITALAPREWNYDLPAGHVLFEIPVLTKPDQKRIVINAPVQSLHTIIKGLQSEHIQFEHLYDY